MADTVRERFWRARNPIMWACLVTAGFIGLIVWFGLAETCNVDIFPKGDCPPKWRHLQMAPPNEVGDTLAGLAGVLAFIWLIATVLLQSVELGEQRRVLALQRQEMEEQRIATQDMARSMAVQAEIFEDERRQRAELQAREVLDQASKEIARCLFEADLDSLTWYVGDDTASSKRERYLEHKQKRLTHAGAELTVLGGIAELFGVAVARLRRVEPHRLRYKPDLPGQLIQLEKYLDLILAHENDLPTVDAEKLRDFGLKNARLYLHSLLTEPYWEQPMGENS
jgi:hypothetical protein